MARELAAAASRRRVDVAAAVAESAVAGAGARAGAARGAFAEPALLNHADIAVTTFTVGRARARLINLTVADFGAGAVTARKADGAVAVDAAAVAVSAADADVGSVVDDADLGVADGRRGRQDDHRAAEVAVGAVFAAVAVDAAERSAVHQVEKAEVSWLSTII